MNGQDVLKLEGVTFSYSGRRYPVLTGLDLSIYRGERVLIVGPNGSGKSTVLKVALGLLTPQEGRACLFSQDVRRFRSWARVGYLSQRSDGFNPGFPATVEEVVSAGLYPSLGFLRMVGRSDRARVRELLEILGLSEQCKVLLSQLSGGQRQKVFLAKALVTEPELLVLDEPDSGLDEDSWRQVNQLLEYRRLTTNLTVALVSHHLATGLVLAKGDRVINLGTAGGGRELVRPAQIREVQRGGGFA